MDVTSYLLGKKSGGGGGSNLQTKNVTITENGTSSVQPDEGYTGLSKVNITTNVSSTDTNNIFVDSQNINYSGEGIKYLIKTVDGTKINSKGLTTVYELFKECYYLTQVISFDMENVTNGYSMFNTCMKLKDVSLVNTSKLTSTSQMFMYCQELENAPFFDTNKVKGFYRMFYNCQKLKNVPIYDTSGATNGMNGIFYGCTSLTTTSLDNILQMCINCPQSSNKTLAYIGIDTANYPVATIQALPHYQDFINAGWAID